MLLLDTAGLPARDRVEAVDAAFRYASAPCRVAHEAVDAGIRARLDLWDLGRANLFRMQATGVCLERTSRHVRTGPSSVVAVAVQELGSGRFAHVGRRGGVGQGELVLMHLGSPYEFSWSGPGASVAYQLDLDELGLPVDVVHRAVGRLRASPVHDLVQAHLVLLARDAPAVSADVGAASVAAATTGLLRALVASAAGDGPPAAEAMAGALLPRVLAYVRQHLREPDLTADRVAAAHHVSRRALYALLADAGISLEQWIIAERLAGARAALLGPDRPTVAVVARTWGFRDPGHFSRRFAAAYGARPRDYRRLAGDGCPGTVPST